MVSSISCSGSRAALLPAHVDMYFLCFVQSDFTLSVLPVAMFSFNQSAFKFTPQGPIGGPQ